MHWDIAHHENLHAGSYRNHKRKKESGYLGSNPVFRGKVISGNDLCVSLAAEAGQLQLNVMEPVIGQAMFESLHILRKAMYNLREDCISRITANETVCRDYMMNSIGIVTLLNPDIGHHHGDEVSRLCRTTGKSVREVVIEKGLMTAQELDRVLSFQIKVPAESN